MGSMASFSSSFEGRPSPPPKTAKPSLASKDKKTVRRPSPIRHVCLPTVNPVVQEQNKGLVVGLTILGVLIFIEGIPLASSGFLPYEQGAFIVTYVYPAFTPIVGLFLVGAVLYGVLSVRQVIETDKTHYVLAIIAVFVALCLIGMWMLSSPSGDEVVPKGEVYLIEKEFKSRKKKNLNNLKKAGEEKKEPQPLDIEEKKEPKVEPDIEKHVADVQVDHEEVKETGEESTQEEQKVTDLEESGGAQSEIQVETKEVPNNNWEMQAQESQEEKEKVEGEEQNPHEEVGSEEESKKEDAAKKVAFEDKSDFDEWTLCDSEDATDYIPCLDNKEVIKNLPSTKHYEHHERHCPSSPPTCLVPLPQGYHTPVPWPKSRYEVWFNNVPHLGLVSYKKDQNWVKKSSDKLIFPGGGTQFKFCEEERELEALTKPSLLEKENASLKMSLEIILEKLKLSDSEQQRLHVKLKDIKFSLQKSIHEWDALNADHANEVAAFRMQNAANECQIQELMEQVQEKTLQSEQLRQMEASRNSQAEKLHGQQMEASRNSQAEKLHGQQSQLRSTKNELETVKVELAGKKVELEIEKLAKPTMIQALNANAMKLKNQRGQLSGFATALDGHKMAVGNERLANRLHWVEGTDSALSESWKSQALTICWVGVDEKPTLIMSAGD
ncbi:hypothetical protein L7F22_034968 [Adiantum nelumboides]|nr:hypothetical protein [Adiantum nelumboides]